MEGQGSAIRPQPYYPKQTRVADEECPESSGLYGKFTALDPAIPEVREHLASVRTEVAQHYDVDGLCPRDTGNCW